MANEKKDQFIKDLESGKIRRLTEKEKKKLRRMVPGSVLLFSGLFMGFGVGFPIALWISRKRREAERQKLSEQRFTDQQLQEVSAPAGSPQDVTNKLREGIAGIDTGVSNVENNLQQMDALYQSIAGQLPAQVRQRYVDTASSTEEGLRNLGQAINYLWNQSRIVSRGIYALPVGLGAFYTISFPLVLSLLPKVNLTPCGMAEKFLKNAKQVGDFGSIITFMALMAAVQTIVSMFSLEVILYGTKGRDYRFTVTKNPLAWLWGFLGSGIYQLLTMACFPYVLSQRKKKKAGKVD